MLWVDVGLDKNWNLLIAWSPVENFHSNWCNKRAWKDGQRKIFSFKRWKPVVVTKLDELTATEIVKVENKNFENVDWNLGSNFYDFCYKTLNEVAWLQPTGHPFITRQLDFTLSQSSMKTFSTVGENSWKQHRKTILGWMWWRRWELGHRAIWGITDTLRHPQEGGKENIGYIFGFFFLSHTS